MFTKFAYSLLLMASLAYGSESAMAQHSSYEELQAAYIFNFAKYVKWPGESPSFVVGVYGEPEILDFLQKTFTGKKITNKEIEIRIINNPEEMAACHIIYVPESGSKNMKTLVAAVDGKSILIVTEDDLIKKGAVISFIVEDDRLKFKLKESALAAAGLTATTGLLKLAILQR